MLSYPVLWAGRLSRRARGRRRARSLGKQGKGSDALRLTEPVGDQLREPVEQAGPRRLSDLGQSRVVIGRVALVAGHVEAAQGGQGSQARWVFVFAHTLLSHGPRLPPARAPLPSMRRGASQ